MMPGEDGLTFLRHVKARPDWQAIPAIVVSACVRQEDRVGSPFGPGPMPFCQNRSHGNN